MPDAQGNFRGIAVSKLPKGMDEAHRDDYRDERRLKDLAHAISEFLQNPPPRCRRSTETRLRDAHTALQADAAHIVAVWD